MIIGVSTRKYNRSIEIPQNNDGRNVSKSTVSRSFVSKTQERLEKWLSEAITDSYPVIMIDGIEFKKRTVVIALGIRDNGDKKVLGCWLGSTENWTLCVDLIQDLVKRGLNPDIKRLFVIDGGKAIRKAIVDVFGDNAEIQRCQVHKTRNVLDYLPKEKKDEIKKELQNAYYSDSYKEAKAGIDSLIKKLDNEYPEAASSLKEGKEETLTVLRIDVPEKLRKTLSTTNPIENLNGTIRYVSRRVKMWRNSNMIKRWVYTGIFEAEKGFKRINGYKDIPIFLEKLNGS